MRIMRTSKFTFLSTFLSLASQIWGYNTWLDDTGRINKTLLVGVNDISHVSATWGLPCTAASDNQTLSLPTLRVYEGSSVLNSRDTHSLTTRGGHIEGVCQIPIYGRDERKLRWLAGGIFLDLVIAFRRRADRENP